MNLGLTALFSQVLSPFCHHSIFMQSQTELSQESFPDVENPIQYLSTGSTLNEQLARINIEEKTTKGIFILIKNQPHLLYQ